MLTSSSAVPPVLVVVLERKKAQQHLADRYHHVRNCEFALPGWLGSRCTSLLSEVGSERPPHRSSLDWFILMNRARSARRGDMSEGSFVGRMVTHKE